MHINKFKQTLISFLLIFGFAFCISTIKAQDSLQDKLIEDGKLKWSDFAGKRDTISTYWATTNWYVRYKYSINHFQKDTVILDMNVWLFLKANSWVLVDKESDELLQHEQGHFDFARLLALEFKNEASSTVLLFGNYKYKLDSIFNALLTKISQMEIQYDKETNHMWNREEQELWNEKISAMLKEAE